ncbi:MAG: peptide ABC transporter substrate-binding protein [Verrucomicrobiota bacterium]|nr:MAG: peptide ABC transporter substrate-binding protein [Verrucomicrobiota bacterium]
MKCLRTLFLVLVLVGIVIAVRHFQLLPTAKDTLRIGNSTEVATLDPQLAPGLDEGKVVSAIFEGLFVPATRDLKPLPGVAESYVVSKNRREYTFTLRENARWSNGDPVVAGDFVNAVRRGLSTNLGSPWAELYFVLLNAQRYYNDEVTDFSKVGIEAVNSRTLKLTLEEPIDYLPSLLMHWAWSPVHKTSIKRFGSPYDRNNPWTRVGNIVTNGPYVLQSIEVGDKIVVSKNKYYWDYDNVAIGTIQFLSGVDTMTEENMFNANQIDITDNVAAEKIEFYKSQKLLKTTATLGSFFFWFNCTRPPFDDVRVRKALSLAIDRSAIGKLRGRGDGFEAYALVPPGTFNYNADRHLMSEDVTLAKQLLREAGYPDGKGFPKVAFVYNTTPGQKLIAEAVQEMWRRNLGIKIDLQSFEWGVFLGERRAHNFAICRGGWIGDYNDATTFLDLFRSDSPNNHAQWKNKEYDALLEQAAKAPENRAAILSEAERLIFDEMPIVPLYYDSTCHLVAKRVGGWHANILDWHALKFVYFR